VSVDEFHRPIRRVFLIHGYSVFQLNSYGKIPQLLAPQFTPQNILLSEYISLDNAVDCDDLAIALEAQIAQQLRNVDDFRETALVCHSTGAIVARRWILNRLAKRMPLPSHLITVAGANHGSSLAQVGGTAIARVFRWIMQDGRAVGERVLADLDYGSTFLWTLNTEWLDAWNTKGLPGQVYCFGFGGDQHGASLLTNIPEFPEVPGWQFLEPGSDSIVRVSGANLNYSLLTADIGAGTLRPPQKITPRAAHLVIPKWTHGGVLGGVQSDADPPFVALREALQVRTDADYGNLVARWQQQTDAWATQNAAQVNATIAFRLRDETARPIDDSWILLQDPTGSASNMSGSLLPNQPIQNGTEHCAISFYVNYAQFAKFPSHKIQIEAHSGSPSIAYRQVNYASPPGAQLVYPNEFTYVDVAIPRDVDRTYAIVPFSAGPDPNKTWPPVPQI
jgi:hypothetical protein